MTQRVGSNLGLTSGFPPGFNGWGAPMNANIRFLDALIFGAVRELFLNDPPTTPALGDRHIIGPAPTGVWIGKSNQVAVWTEDETDTNLWEYHTARDGWRLDYSPTDTSVAAYQLLFRAGAWEQAFIPASVMVASGTGHKGGLVPDPGAAAGVTKFLREDGTWQIPAGGGGGGGGNSAGPAWGVAAFSRPDLSAFTTVAATPSAGGSSIAATFTDLGSDLPITFSQPATNVNDIDYRAMAVPATPFTLTACLEAQLSESNQNLVAGILLINSAGQFYEFGVKVDNNLPRVQLYRWNNQRDYNSSIGVVAYENTNTIAPNPTWLRVINDGTELSFGWSVNNQHYITIFQESLATFITAVSLAGFGICGGGGGVAVVHDPIGGTLWHWAFT